MVFVAVEERGVCLFRTAHTDKTAGFNAAMERGLGSLARELALGDCRRVLEGARARGVVRQTTGCDGVKRGRGGGVGGKGSTTNACLFGKRG